MSKTGKFSNYSSIWRRNSLLCSLHVKLCVGISVGSSVEGLCQELGENKGSQCEPKNFRTGSLQAMVLHKTCCSSPAETSTDTSWGAEGDRASTASLVASQPCSSGLSVGAHCWCSSAPSAPTWQKLTLPPLPQVDLLQFESWSCSEVSEVVRVHEGEHGHLIFSLQMPYKHKDLKEVNKTVVDRERCTS